MGSDREKAPDLRKRNRSWVGPEFGCPASIAAGIALAGRLVNGGSFRPARLRHCRAAADMLGPVWTAVGLMMRPGSLLLLLSALLLLPALPQLSERLRSLLQGNAGPPMQSGASLTRWLRDGLVPDRLVQDQPPRSQPQRSQQQPFPQDLLRLQPSPAGRPALPQRQPAERPLAQLENGLLQRLSQADQAWIPRAEPLPGGGVRYHYRRRSGEPPLTIPQIKALIARPPVFATEQRRIRSLLEVLDRAGAALELSEPLKVGAAGEWDPRRRTLRLRPNLPQRGSVEFARVLNHEAIHVAQSCAAGGINAPPRPLQIALRPNPDPTAGRGAVVAPLDDPLYADLSPIERQLELEAYALQNRLELGERLVRLHCLNG